MGSYEWGALDGEDNDAEVAVDFGNIDSMDSIVSIDADDSSDNLSDSYDEDDDIKLSKPPRENEALRMVQTFQSIYETSEALLAAMNVGVAETRKAGQFVGKIKTDVDEIVTKYDIGVQKINKQLVATQKYFETNQNIAKELSFMKDELRSEFKTLNSTIKEAQEGYVDSIVDATSNISLKLNDFSKGLDLTGVEKVVKGSIEKVVKDSTLDRVESALKNTADSFFKLEDSITVLMGQDKKKGLLEEFSEEVFLISEKLETLKMKSNASSVIFAFFIGAILFGGGVWAYLTLSYQKNLSLALAEHTVVLNESWVKKLNEKEQAYKGFESFMRKYNIGNKNSGFGYFEDTKTPYFYYDVESKGQRVGDKVYIELR